MSTQHAFSLICTILLICLPQNQYASGEQTIPASEFRWTNEFRSLGSWWRYQSVLGTTNDGKQLLIGGNGKHLVFYDLTKGMVVRTLVTREGMQGAALSPDGRFLGVAEWRDGFTLRDAYTFDVLKTFSGSAGLGAWQVRFSPDSNRLLCYSRWFNAASRTSEKQFFTYDLVSDQQTDLATYQMTDTPSSFVRERFGRNGTHVFSIEKTRERARITGYRLWVTDRFTGQASEKIKLNDGDFHQFDLSPDGRRAIIQQPGEPVRVIDTQDGETISALPGRLWATGAAFSPDGRLIATVRGTKHRGLIATDKRPKVRTTNIVIHDAASGNELARLEHPDVHRDYYQVGFSQNGDYVFSVTAEQKSRREVVLWGDLPEIPSQIDPLPSFENAMTPPPTPNESPIKLRPSGVGVRFCPPKYERKGLR